ncbi:MAG: hypothetical protein PHT07_20975 [Paludibacter sp.]|nr:hypothetical protein [Paludibacter sp.]
MSEEEKETHAELIEKIIGRKMIPIYMINGGMALTVISIFIAIAWPIRDSVGQNQVDISKCISSDEAYKNFLSKGVYHLLQKDEHESDLQAIRHPEDADFIYMKNNSSEEERLELTSRGSSHYKEAYNKVKNEAN